MDNNPDKKSEEKEKALLKDVEYYATALTAWYNTRMELDKSLLLLSGGAIGLLITLLTTLGVKNTMSFLVFMAALLCFIICLGSILIIFRVNSDYLQQTITEQPNKQHLLKALEALDKTASWSFISGVLLSVLIALSAALEHIINTKESGQRPTIKFSVKSYDKKGEPDSPEDPIKFPTYNPFSTTPFAPGSFAGADKLRPPRNPENPSVTNSLTNETKGIKND